MKVLYAIQGTGNGHLSRAKDIVPLLQKKVDLDLLVSGNQAEVSIPFPVEYRLRGLSFVFGKRGGVDIWDTYKNADSKKLIREIRSLPVEKYDLVISDFDPVSTWAARLKKVPCVALSHQAAVLNKNAPKPKRSDWVGKQILRYYAPAEFDYGFHFERYDHRIFTPVIREQIRAQEIAEEGHYTVYLPAYGDKKLIRNLSQYKGIKWEVFSKHSKASYREKNVFIQPIQGEAFVKSMASSEGVLCGAGFETPAEALYLNKKLMVLPMKTQYEQQCNAAALKNMGVPVIRGFKDKYLRRIERWLNSDHRILVDYPNQTEMVIDKVLENHLIRKEEMELPPVQFQWPLPNLTPQPVG